MQREADQREVPPDAGRGRAEPVPVTAVVDGRDVFELEQRASVALR